ncbi:MAG: GNAT family N-acetyltransferase [Bacteroidota bacterium]
MTIRSLTVADIDAAHALWNAVARYDPLSRAVFVEKVWEDDGVTPDLALAAEVDGDLIGFAVGVVREAPVASNPATGRAGTVTRGPTMRGVVKLLAVHETYQRQGIGTALVDALEAAMVARGAAAIRLGESPPNYLHPGLDPRYTRALLLFEKRGYEKLANAIHMDVDLTQDLDTSADEARLLADNITVARARPSDESAVMAFVDAHWPAWKAEVGRTFRNDPVSLHLAWEGGGVLGFSAYDANNIGASATGTGWFGPMGTAAAARGRGVGAVLLKRCLADMAVQGHAVSTIPWVAPVGFYAHHVGAHISRVFYRYEKTAGA